MFGTEEKYRWLFTLCTIVQFIIFISVTKPLFHEISMTFYLHPWIMEAFIISLLAGLIIGAIRKFTFDSRFGESEAIGFTVLSFVIFFVILIIMFITLSAYPDCYLAQTLNVNEIDDLPEMDMDFLRITPMKVADRYATDACQYPRHTPSKPSDITIINGTPYWAYLLVPDGIMNTYNIKPKGVVFVDMTTTEKDLEVIEYEFEVAPDLALTDHIHWKIHELNYWVDCERTLVVCSSDRTLAVKIKSYMVPKARRPIF